MSSTVKYSFSFTAGSLMLQELIAYAKILVENNQQQGLLDAASLNKDKAKTNKREFAEIKLRLSKLSPAEIELLHDAELTTQKLIAYIAFCKSYSFFKDFVIEVLLEKVQLFDFILTDRDYNSFISRKEVDHEELERLTDLTKAKIKQVTIKVLEQAGLIDNIKNRNIQPPLVELRLENVLREDSPESLVYLLQKQYA